MRRVQPSRGRRGGAPPARHARPIAPRGAGGARARRAPAAHPSSRACALAARNRARVVDVACRAAVRIGTRSVRAPQRRTRPAPARGSSDRRPFRGAPSRQRSPQREELLPCPYRDAKHRPELALDARAVVMQAAGTVLDELKDRPPGNRLTCAGAPSETVGRNDHGESESDADGSDERGRHDLQTTDAAASYGRRGRRSHGERG